MLIKESYEGKRKRWIEETIAKITKAGYYTETIGYLDNIFYLDEKKYDYKNFIKMIIQQFFPTAKIELDYDRQEIILIYHKKNYIKFITQFEAKTGLEVVKYE